jgi:hypothetical protein
MSLAEDIRAYATGEKSPVLKVPSPELPNWDGQLGVCRRSPRAIAKHWKDSEEEESIDERARFVVLVTCDLEGNRIFGDADTLWLSCNNLLTPLVERFYWAGRQHNGLTEENRRAWEKNSAPTAAAGSPSSSSAPSRPSDSASQET